VRVHLATEHASEFELAHAGLELPGIALDVARGGLIALALGQLQQLRGIADGTAGTIDFAQFADQARTLTPELLGALGRAPDLRIFQLAADFF
jgi:hypothetical protein